ncbi:hypothetical protein GVN18_44135, partial [Pseudomonas sp. ODNR1LW]|nr:hypothetical protein [Pseudomonas sp. ODNR1LW]
MVQEALNNLESKLYEATDQLARQGGIQSLRASDSEAVASTDLGNGLVSALRRQDAVSGTSSDGGLTVSSIADVSLSATPLNPVSESPTLQVIERETTAPRASVVFPPVSNAASSRELATTGPSIQSSDVDARVPLTPLAPDVTAPISEALTPPLEPAPEDNAPTPVPNPVPPGPVTGLLPDPPPEDAGASPDMPTATTTPTSPISTGASPFDGAVTGSAPGQGSNTGGASPAGTSSNGATNQGGGQGASTDGPGLTPAPASGEADTDLTVEAGLGLVDATLEASLDPVEAVLGSDVDLDVGLDLT